jgi:hypothetical protein
LEPKGEPEVDLNQSDCVSRDEITRSILKFFLQSPGQVESFVGIARWRLLEEEVRSSVKRTEEGLLWLVAKGFLTVATVGSRPVYTLNPEKLEEAKQLVGAEADDPGDHTS